MGTITIKGRYGKSKRAQTISFDSSRFGKFDKIRTNKLKEVAEYYIYIDGESRKITFTDEREMLSFTAQLHGEPKTETLLDLTEITKVKAQFIDASHLALHQDPNNCTLFNWTTYMFDLPRVGERFNSNGLQWKVEDFIRVDEGTVKIYLRLSITIL